MSQLDYRNFRKFKGQKKISVLDLAVLVANILIASRDTEIGFVDADRTMEQLLESLNFSFPVTPEALESALWSCNMLDEKKAFFHPFGGTFDSFLKKLRLQEQFDKRYNMIKEG